MDGGWSAGHDDAAQVLARGNGLAAEGKFSEAAEAYRAALALRRDWAEAWTKLGTVLAAAGQYAPAIAAHRLALRHAPDDGVVHCNLAIALQQSGRHADAAQAYRAALLRHPNNPVLNVNLGNMLLAAKDPAGAAAAYISVTMADPKCAAAHFGLGLAREMEGRLADAEAAYDAARRADPAALEVLAKLGDVRTAQGKFPEAIAAYRALLARKPSFADGWTNLGVAQYKCGRLEEAEASYRRALALDANHVSALSNLGTAQAVQGDFDGAASAYRAALAVRADYAEAWSNLGSALAQLRRFGEAEHALQTALELAPGSAETIFNLSMIFLMTGRLAAGWALHEARWHYLVAPRGWPQPQWTGAALEGRTILIHAEQGFGDTLQFVRYAPLVAELGGRVILELPSPLVRLLGRLPGIAEVVPQDGRTDPLPPFDLHCPMASLPLAFGTTLETIPAAPYITADPALTERWRARLPADGCRVGLVWTGRATIGQSENRGLGRLRSVPLDQLVPLADVPGVHFVSLQKDVVPDAEPAGRLGLIDMMDEVTDFADTAALIGALDLVIAIDTSVAHLAGAMGKPVLLLLCANSCWRWLEDRDDSPWYPSARLFRQANRGEWDPVIARVREALAEFAA